MQRLMELYLETTECRRKVLLSHFESNQEVMLQSNSKCCDNCLKQIAGKLLRTVQPPEIDVRPDAKILLKAVKVFGGRFGLGVPIAFVRGKNHPKLYSSYLKHELYGSGKDQPEQWWKSVGRLLVREGLLSENTSSFSRGPGKWKNFPMSTTGITRLGEQFLEEDDNYDHIKLVPTPEMIQIYKKRAKPVIPKVGEWQPVHKPEISPSNKFGSDRQSTLAPEMDSVPESSQPENKDIESEDLLQSKIYNELMGLRMKLASDTNCMPYMVANNKTLLDLAKLRPTNKQQLLNVEGFGEAKVKKFGDAIINKICELCGVSISDPVNSQGTFDNGNQEAKKSAETMADTSEASTVVDADNLWGDEDDSFLEEIELDKTVFNEETKAGSDYGDDIWDNDLEDKLNETLQDVEESLSLNESQSKIDVEDLCDVGLDVLQDSTSSTVSSWQSIKPRSNTVNINMGVNKNDICDNMERDVGKSNVQSVSAGTSWEAAEFGKRIHDERHTVDSGKDSNNQKTTLDSNKGWQKSNVHSGSDSDSESRETQTINKRKLPEWLTKSNAKKEVKRRMKMNSLFK